MNAIDILEKWFNYSEYDPNRTTFNLLSSDYMMHKACENIEKLSSYDPSGTFAVLYAKHCFEECLKQARVKAYDVVANPDYLIEEREMYNIFNSPDVTTIENALLNDFNTLIMNATQGRQIGVRDREKEKEALFSSITAVTEQLVKCNVDLFARGGVIQPIKNFSMHIHVFNWLAECLCALEHANDGMYLCYIKCGDTADGYFGYYIKSNGNILSVNERVDEAFPGQHKRSRNGRWSEDKKHALFPYNFIFEYKDYDYKGYAGKHIINEDELSFLKLSAEAYMPLLLGMIALSLKYSGQSTSDLPIKYVDSLLPVNNASPVIDTKSLVPVSNSAVIESHKSLSVSFSNDDIKTAAIADRYNGTNKVLNYKERGSFYAGENIFVRLYGDGFALDSSKLLLANKHLLVASSASEDALPDVEFVGTAPRMEMIGYMQARAQLALYIQDKIYEEYKRYGGVEALKEWWAQTVRNSKAKLFNLCIEQYNRSEDDKSKPYISSKESKNGYAEFGFKCPFNTPQGYDVYGRANGKYACPITGAKASIFFYFNFSDWTQIAEVFGENSIPKILKGWTTASRRTSGNSLLDATDPVEKVGTPFEYDTKSRDRRYWTKEEWRDHLWHKHRCPLSDLEKLVPEKCEDISPNSISFKIGIGFSKRGLTSLMKTTKQTSEK